MQDFCVVIPVYNHEHSVAEVAEKALELNAPVIVVDDGSTDRSGSKAENVKGVRVLHHGLNRGKGAALLTGLKEASKLSRWALTLDADGQHNPADAPALLSAAKKANRPIVIGSRTGMDSQDVPWTSRFGRKFSNLWVFLSGGPRLSDTQSGFRLYPVPEVLYLRAAARRFQFEVEILVKASWKGVPVIEAPVAVAYTPEGRRISHFRPFIDFVRNSNTFTRLILQRIFIPAIIRKKW
jgi:glycosyltransferase involved in cell wall biosynthesis